MSPLSHSLTKLGWVQVKRALDCHNKVKKKNSTDSLCRWGKREGEQWHLLQNLLSISSSISSSSSSPSPSSIQSSTSWCQATNHLSRSRNLQISLFDSDTTEPSRFSRSISISRYLSFFFSSPYYLMHIVWFESDSWCALRQWNHCKMQRCLGFWVPLLLWYEHDEVYQEVDWGWEARFLGFYR